MLDVPKISVDKYLRMIKDGLLAEDARVELISGRLVAIPVPSPLHAETTTRLNEWSRPECADRLPFSIRLKSPITISDHNSCPQPDVIWIDEGDYWERFPDCTEVRLLVEIADSSLGDGRHFKRELYASAGIRDYWAVDLPNRRVHVFREPKDGVYSQHTMARMGNEIRPLANPLNPLSVSRLFEP
jgi:Uma2 family endonuclease